MKTQEASEILHRLGFGLLAAELWYTRIDAVHVLVRLCNHAPREALVTMCRLIVAREDQRIRTEKEGEASG